MIKRIPVYGILIILFYTYLPANNFALNPNNLLTQKSADFIQKVSQELLEKTGINLYVYMGESLDGKDYVDFKENFIRQLKEPFVAIVLIKNDKKIDIISSKENLFDRKKVYWEYMVPLIPTKDSEITPEALSAVVFNGYIESVDLIADKFDTKIEHNIPKDEKGAKAVAQLILYIMLFSMLGIVAFMYIIRNRRNTNNGQ